MRSIKFRVYSEQGTSWKNQASMYSWDEVKRAFALPWLFEEAPDTYHVMRWSGLHDKNGVEIYEDDIVSIGKVMPWHGRVIYEGAAFTPRPLHPFETTAMVSTLGFYEPIEVEVLGNSWETPDLLR